MWYRKSALGPRYHEIEQLHFAGNTGNTHVQGIFCLSLHLGSGRQMFTD